MKKEKISINRKEISIKIQASEINSIRVKNIERNAVRVFKNGYIGISGAVGSSSEEELTEQSIDNLSSKIPYPYKLESSKREHRDFRDTHYGEKKLMILTEKILSSLNQEFDDFIFSESVQSIEMDYKIENTDGLDLRYQDEYLNFGFVVKAKSSPNLFDTFIGWSGRNLDYDKLLSFIHKQLQAERNKVELPLEEKVPVFFLSPDSLNSFLIRQLNGETYGNKASLFDNKIGEKLFNDKLTIVQNNNPMSSYSNFFDTEGVTMKNDSVTLIKNGVLKHVFTDKKTAKKFNLEHTGSASGGYDDIPTLGYINLQPQIDSKHIKKTLKGQKAILVMVAAGGEFNADGNYATPVQASYLFDGKYIIGKLPEFSMSNDIYSMLGSDYIGTFHSNDLYFGEDDRILSCFMNIKKD
jgi:PmbA protein